MPCKVVGLDLLYFYYVLLFLCFLVTAQSSWPPNTQVAASSEHAPEGLAFYYSKFAIDGDNTTLWSDQTNDSFPDILRIGPPSPVNLTGLSITSNLNGWITAYRVGALVQNNSWVQVAQLQDIPSISSSAIFAEPIECLQVQIIVDNATTGENNTRYSRINEIEPRFVVGDAPVASNQTASNAAGGPAASQSTGTTQTAAAEPKSDTSSDHKGIIIGSVLGGSAFLGFLTILFCIGIRRRNKGRSQPSPWPWDRMKEPTINVTESVQELDGKKVCEACGAEKPRVEVQGVPRAELEARVFNEKTTGTNGLSGATSPISPASTGTLTKLI